MTFTTPAVTSRTSLERFSGSVKFWSFQNPNKHWKENCHLFIHNSSHKSCWVLIFCFSPLLVSFAPKLKTPSTAISTHRTPTCCGILGSWWRPLRTPRLTTSTTLWWERSSMTARSTVTALCVMCSWMCVWTTETLRGGLLLLLHFVVCVWLCLLQFFTLCQAVASCHVSSY